MSHTYSRTAALLGEFAASFVSADEVILHKIYASAREQYDGTVSGKTLYDATRKKHRNVQYFEEVLDARDYLAKTLRPGDLFVTMGAGDNWRIGREILEDRKNARNTAQHQQGSVK
jgi:UDP-N-acetylmuramate--alanine ligase